MLYGPPSAITLPHCHGLRCRAWAVVAWGQRGALILRPPPAVSSHSSFSNALKFLQLQLQLWKSNFRNNLIIFGYENFYRSDAWYEGKVDQFSRTFSQESTHRRGQYTLLGIRCYSWLKVTSLCGPTWPLLRAEESGVPSLHTQDARVCQIPVVRLWGPVTIHKVAWCGGIRSLTISLHRPGCLLQNRSML